MSTYIDIARRQEAHPDFATVGEAEGIDVHQVIKEVASGSLVLVPGRRATKPVALGRSVRSKVLCNMGTSSESPDIALEIKKARMAVEHGAALVCDQSVGRCVSDNRKLLVQGANVPIAAVPLYQNVDDAVRAGGEPLGFGDDDVLAVFEEQVANGVTMPGFHSMSLSVAKVVGASTRLMPLVSRGAGLMFEWLKRTGRENPYFERFDVVLEVARSHNVPITFVSSVRAGTVVDGFDSVQEFEWQFLRPFIEAAHRTGVSVVVDGLGHMPIDHIGPAVRRFKQLCGEVPLGVLGPAVTDRALGHEHVANAIGTAVAVWSGANYCNACYPTEHLGLPELEDIPSGIGASVIATHAGDLGREGLKERLIPGERTMSTARQKNQWGVMLHHALEQVEARKTFERVGKGNKDGSGCSICGELCPYVVTGKAKPSAS